MLSRRQLEELAWSLRHAVSTGEFISVELLQALLKKAAEQPQSTLH